MTEGKLLLNSSPVVTKRVSSIWTMLLSLRTIWLGHHGADLHLHPFLPLLSPSLTQILNRDLVQREPSVLDDKRDNEVHG